MEIRAIKTTVFKENEDLIQFILKHVKKIKDNSVLVVTSKIVALSEGRTEIFKSEEQKAALIKKESKLAVATKHVWITLKDGMIMASAGIDESNGKGKLILLPKDSFRSADILRQFLKKKFGLKNLGIIITDSALMPLRAGAVGTALGYAGFQGIKNYIGTKDLFGRKFTYAKTNLADSLATAAVLTMGEGREGQPLALIIDAPILFTNKINKRELKMDKKGDIFLPLMKNLNGKK